MIRLCDTQTALFFLSKFVKPKRRETQTSNSAVDGALNAVHIVARLSDSLSKKGVEGGEEFRHCHVFALERLASTM